MSGKKTDYTLTMDKRTHFRLTVLALTKRMVMNEKGASVSKIVNEAVDEWFINHKDEVENIISEYKKNGGWLDL